MGKKRELDKREAALLDALQQKLAQADKETPPPVTLSPCMMVRRLEREGRPPRMRAFPRRAAAVALSALLLAVTVTGGLLARRQMETLPGESEIASGEAGEAFYRPDLRTDVPVTYEDIRQALEQIRQRQQAGTDTAALSRRRADLLSLPRRADGASKAELAAVLREAPDTATSECSSESSCTSESQCTSEPAWPGWESEEPAASEIPVESGPPNMGESAPGVSDTDPPPAEESTPDGSVSVSPVPPAGTGSTGTVESMGDAGSTGAQSGQWGTGTIIDPTWGPPADGQESTPTASDVSGTAGQSTGGSESVQPPVAYQTQEPAVNEADAVAAADGYLYIISQQSDEGRLLHIVKTDGEQMERLSTTPVGYTAAGEVELYADGNYLAVIGSRAEALDGPADAGYVQVDIYDISDPARPSLMRTWQQQGALTGSRVVEGTLYLSTTVTYSDLSGLDADSVAQYLPCYRDSDTGAVAYLAPEQVQIIQDTDRATYCFVAAVDLAGGRQLYASLGGGDLLYSDAESIYIAAVRRTPERVFSEILRISAGDTLDYTGRARVPGLVTDSFFMDTDAGCLRVFTADADGQGTGLYILDGGLAIAGRLENIAPGQRVQSVRFSGDTAYLTVEGETGALLTVNMEDPAHPVLSGGYQAAGLSGRLYPLDGGRMLSVEAADDGITLYLFATGAGAGAEALATCRLETDGDTLDSEAAYNHHAFTYWQEGETCYIPLNTGRGFSGILALRIADDAITPAGIFTAAQSVGEARYGVQAGDWARRTVLMDGAGYAVADGAVLSFDLEGNKADSILRLYASEAKTVEFSGVDRTPIFNIPIS